MSRGDPEHGAMQNAAECQEMKQGNAGPHPDTTDESNHGPQPRTNLIINYLPSGMTEEGLKVSTFLVDTRFLIMIFTIICFVRIQVIATTYAIPFISHPLHRHSSNPWGRSRKLKSQ